MYVHKPISNNDLRDLVRQLLAGGQNADWKQIADTVIAAQGVQVKSARRVARKLRRRKAGARKT